jgi:hypothetical protein
LRAVVIYTMIQDTPKIVIPARPPYLCEETRKNYFEYQGSPKNLFEFASELMLKANRAFGTKSEVDKKLKDVPFTSPGAQIILKFTSEEDLIKFLRNFAYIIKINNKYFLTPKNKSNNLL